MSGYIRGGGVFEGSISGVWNAEIFCYLSEVTNWGRKGGEEGYVPPHLPGYQTKLGLPFGSRNFPDSPKISPVVFPLELPPPTLLGPGEGVILLPREEDRLQVGGSNLDPILGRLSGPVFARRH